MAVADAEGDDGPEAVAGALAGLGVAGRATGDEPGTKRWGTGESTVGPADGGVAATALALVLGLVAVAAAAGAVVAGRTGALAGDGPAGLGPKAVEDAAVLGRVAVETVIADSG